MQLCREQGLQRWTRADAPFRAGEVLGLAARRPALWLPLGEDVLCICFMEAAVRGSGGIPVRKAVGAALPGSLNTATQRVFIARHFADKPAMAARADPIAKRKYNRRRAGWRRWRDLRRLVMAEPRRGLWRRCANSRPCEHGKPGEKTCARVERAASADPRAPGTLEAMYRRAASRPRKSPKITDLARGGREGRNPHSRQH